MTAMDTPASFAWFCIMVIAVTALCTCDSSGPVLYDHQIAACAAVCGSRGVDTVEPDRCVCVDPAFFK